MFYCPKCKKTEMDFNRKDNLQYRREYKTVSNMRGGYGRPISHYLCECGNPLAGSMDIRGLIKNECESEAVDYAKDIITAYNEDGDYFSQDLLDYANEIVRERIKKL